MASAATRCHLHRLPFAPSTAPPPCHPPTQVKQAYRLRKDSRGVLRVGPQATVENMDLVAQEFM